MNEYYDLNIINRRKLYIVKIEKEGYGKMIGYFYDVILKRLDTLQKRYNEKKNTGNFVALVELQAKMEELRYLLHVLDVMYK